MSKETPTPDLSLTDSVARYIKRSRRNITILFTDIEDSTTYWEKHGDIKGRLMVDLHNRLTFPVIRKFRGKIIKTIGDSIMASFKKPENAVRAAIGIQQILEKARRADEEFTLRVRIGIHTGLAVVERQDVFGDVVNAAARVESQAKGNEILLSGATSHEVREYDFGLVHAGVFRPKGKTNHMKLLRCPWEDFESIIDDIKPGSYLPVLARQRAAIGVFVLTAVATAYFFYIQYLRFIIADNKDTAALFLNPHLILEDYPIVLIGLGVLFVAVTVTILRVRAAPHLVLRTLSGSFGFAVGVFIFVLPSTYLPFDLIPTSKTPLHASRYLFVRVQEDDAPVLAEPRDDAEVIRTVDAGDILLQVDYAKRKGLWWDKVFLGTDQFGWLVRKSPAKIGVPEKQISEAGKFYFRHRDLYGLILGLVGFVWGFRQFRIRPT